MLNTVSSTFSGLFTAAALQACRFITSNSKKIPFPFIQKAFNDLNPSFNSFPGWKESGLDS